ncbi:Retrovirus-related Pol polyprotein from transposon 412 [Formica fusca]
MRQAKDEKLRMLCDSGSTISLIKLKQLKDDTLIYEDKIALTGITGHKVHTIGKMYAAIKVDGHKLEHVFYAVKDDIPIEYEGILGIDFLRQHSVSFNYKQNQLKIGEAVLKFHSFNKIILKPRSETIVKAATNQNRIGIVRAEETAPGIYIGNCLVESKYHACPVSVMNTTDTEVEIQTPHVVLEDIEYDRESEIYTIQTRKNSKPTSSRYSQI